MLDGQESFFFLFYRSNEVSIMKYLRNIQCGRKKIIIKKSNGKQHTFLLLFFYWDKFCAYQEMENYSTVCMVKGIANSFFFKSKVLQNREKSFPAVIHDLIDCQQCTDFYESFLNRTTSTLYYW